MAVFVSTLPLSSDQVQMQNGDHYNGKVVSLSSDTLVLQNENLGPLRLPRAKIASINFATVKETNLAGAPLSITNLVARKPLPAANPSTADAAVLRQLGAHTNLIKQVQTRFLADAGPEANAKFDELLAGLSSGKLNLNDLLAQARTTADQLRTARKDLGEDGGPLLDSYLSILDHFLKDAGPVPSPQTNASKTLPQPNLLGEEQ